MINSTGDGTSSRLRDFERDPLDLIKISADCGFSDDEYDISIRSLPINKYLLPNEINGHVSPGSVRLASLNCCGLMSSLDHLSSFLPCYRVDVLAVCETFLNESTSHLANINGYNFISKTRNDRSRGGLGFFIHNDITYRIVSDFDSMYEEMLFEFLVVELDFGNEKVLCCLFYRPPSSSVQHFISKLEAFSSIAIERSRKIMYIGDFNIDISNAGHDLSSTQYLPSAVDFLTLCLSLGLLPACRIPTRVVSSTATVIDNIFLNMEFDSCHVIIDDTSDHFMLLMEIKTGRQTATPIKTTRRLDATSVQRLNELLLKIDPSPCLDCEDVNQASQYFVNEFTTALNVACPMSSTRLRRYNRSKKPWVTRGLLRSIQSKNRLYKIYLSNPDETNQAFFKAYRNCLTKALRSAKQLYYLKAFNSAHGSPKKVWTLINDCIGKKKLNSFPDEMMPPGGDTAVKGKLNVANMLNTHFAKIGEKTSEEASQKSTPNSADFKSFLPSSTDRSIFLTPVSSAELMLVLHQLKNGHSEGIDGSSTNLLKSIMPSIVNFLVHIINLCFKNGIFPSCMKSARVIALHKGGDINDPSNYRPISILSAFGKIIERCLYVRIVNFLDKNSFFSKSQFGFRKGHSTEHAILAVTQFIHDALDKGEIPASIFVDIRKAFDTICHMILNEKLSNCGIRGPAKSIILSYLSDRVQCIDGGEVISTSSNQSNKVGVPQGSILGPLLFLIYVNDISNSVEDLGLTVLFADDTACSVSGIDEDRVKHNLSLVFDRLVAWFTANRLALNTSKTKFMVFSRTSRALPCLKLIKSSVSGMDISRVEIIRYLGVLVDSNLSWKPHINGIRLKLGRNVGIMQRMKFILPLEAMRSIYFALVHSYLNYCPLIYLNTFRSHLIPLQRQQNKALRILKSYLPSPASFPSKSSTKSLYCLLNILPVELAVTFNSILFKVNHNLLSLPSYFFSFDLFPVAPPSSHLARSIRKLRQPLIISERSRFSLRNSVVAAWNQYESIFDFDVSIGILKNKIKSFLLDIY